MLDKKKNELTITFWTAIDIFVSRIKNDEGSVCKVSHGGDGLTDVLLIGVTPRCGVANRGWKLAQDRDRGKDRLKKESNKHSCRECARKRQEGDREEEIEGRENKIGSEKEREGIIKRHFWCERRRKQNRSSEKKGKIRERIPRQKERQNVIQRERKEMKRGRKWEVWIETSNLKITKIDRLKKN